MYFVPSPPWSRGKVILKYMFLDTNVFSLHPLPPPSHLQPGCQRPDQAEERRRYEQDLKEQVDHKKRVEEELKRKEKEEEEKLERRLKEQQERMMKEYEEETRRKKIKDEAVG